MRRTTAKDIAVKCGVSRAVASAILGGGSKGTIRFSQEVKERVLKTAKAMNYVPNRLATAMKTGKIPLVAFCLHVIHFTTEEVNLYLHDMLPAAALKLQEYGYEMIFVPFVDTDEQLRRMPVVVLSTTDNPREIETCKNLHCSSYIVKAAGYKALAEALQPVRLLLEHRQAPRTTGQS